jgi:hypothetical protein
MAGGPQESWFPKETAAEDRECTGGLPSLPKWPDCRWREAQTGEWRRADATLRRTALTAPRLSAFPAEKLAIASCRRLVCAGPTPYDSPMLYRIARSIAEGFKFVAFGGFVVAFFIALAFVFILPIVPLFLIISAPFALVGCWLASDLLSAVEQALGRRGVRRGICPACHHGLERFTVDGVHIHECAHCRRIFEEDGDIWHRSPDAHSNDPADSGTAFRPSGLHGGA